MGHRSFLFMQNENKGIDYKSAFEANNSLPAFWVGLLDKKKLEKQEEAWFDSTKPFYDDEAQKAYYSIYPSPTWLVVDEISFKKNSERYILYLQTHYPKAVSLFLDFKNYIGSKFTNECQFLFVDIIELSNFTSVEKMLNDLYIEIQSIDENKLKSSLLYDEDLIAFGVGFSPKEFEKKSIAYQEANNNRKAITYTEPKKIDTKKTLLKHLIIIIIAILFTFHSGYLKDGWTLGIIILTILNISFYLYSFWRTINISITLLKGETKKTS